MVSEFGGAAVHSGLHDVRRPRGTAGGCRRPGARGHHRVSDGSTSVPVSSLEHAQRSGGGVWPLRARRGVAAARELGLGDLDGARFLDAAVALGVAATRIGAPADGSRSASPRASGVRSVRLSPGRPEPIERARARSICSAVRCARRGWSRRRGSMRSTTTSSGSPTTTRGRVGSRRVARGRLPVDPGAVETNFVQLDAGRLGIRTRRGCGAAPRRGSGPRGDPPGAVAPSRISISDDDIERASALVPRALDGRASRA